MKKSPLLLSAVSLLALTSCQTGVKHNINEYVFSKTVEYVSNFKIMQLTDTHLGDMDELDTHYKFLDLLITEANPNYIVVTGDLFTFSSKTNAMRFFNFLDSYNTPWTVVFGNHDEQCFFSVDWMTEQLNKFGGNCYFKDIQDDNVHGNCNFAVNIMQGTSIFEQLIFIDSNRYDFSGFKGYDVIKTNQVKWYGDLVDYTKAQNSGTTVESLMFYHIPVPEIDAAWENGTNKQGEKREASCPPNKNTGLFKEVVDKGSTKGMFFGHDHLNDFDVDYQGVKFCYGLKSTDRIYCADDMLGYKLITLKDDHSFDVTSVFHTYKEVM